MTDIPVGHLGELTTVASRHAVLHRGTEVVVHDGLVPDTVHELDGFTFRTLPEPGELLCTFATANDVHFGEEVCGLVTEDPDIGPVFRSEPGDPPYPVVMNQGAVDEILALDPAVVLIKGDLTSHGTQAEYDQFLSIWEGAFGDRLRHVRGNHESYYDAPFSAVAHQRVDLPGATLALLDTSVVRSPNGALTADQLEWLDTLAAEADRPVLVYGHHHVWNPASAERPDGYFGIHPDSSERLVELVARRPSIIGYFAGHTHRNRVRHFAATGGVPWSEVSCVKDYPGAWAEYRVHEGGVLQVFHRISTSAALVWTEKTRQMFMGLYGGYAFGALEDRCFVIDPRS